MRRRLAVVVWLSALSASPAGCTGQGELRESTRESSRLQLEAAARSGIPTELIAIDEALDASEAWARHEGRDDRVTYLVVTQNDAQIVWSNAFSDAAPANERAIIGRWVLPYLRVEDPDTAAKALVFGYLREMQLAGHLEWDAAIVPFEPARSEGKTVTTTRAWGAFAATVVFTFCYWTNMEHGDMLYSIVLF